MHGQNIRPRPFVLQETKTRQWSWQNAYDGHSNNCSGGIRGRFRNVGVRFRTGVTDQPIGGRGPANQTVDGRRGGPPGAREQPRYQGRPIDPQIEDLNIVNAKTGWTPNFTTTFSTNSNDAPNQNFLAGAQGTITKRSVLSNLGVTQTLPWGGSYDVGWDSSRFNSNSSFSTFSPQLRSTLGLNYTQPLLRNWKIDNTRQQVLITSKNREIADVSVRQTVAITTRTYGTRSGISHTRSHHSMQRQSFDLANESLRDTRARVEIGTTPPIDIVAAEAEVARRQEAVIVAEGNIGDAEDALRTLVFDPSAPDFWTMKIEPTELPPFVPVTVDVDAAVKNALSRRTDLLQSRKAIEADDINIRFYRNQRLPDVNAS